MDAHKVILMGSQKSPKNTSTASCSLQPHLIYRFFSAESTFFKEKLAGADTKEIEIDDVNGATMKEVLNFIYKGFVKKFSKKTKKMLVLAEKVLTELN